MIVEGPEAFREDVTYKSLNRQPLVKVNSFIPELSLSDT